MELHLMYVSLHHDDNVMVVTVYIANVCHVQYVRMGLRYSSCLNYSL